MQNKYPTLESASRISSTASDKSFPSVAAYNSIIFAAVNKFYEFPLLTISNTKEYKNCALLSMTNFKFQTHHTSLKIWCVV